jgi:hypothetical protein
MQQQLHNTFWTTCNTSCAERTKMLGWDSLNTMQTNYKPRKNPACHPIVFAEPARPYLPSTG